MKGAELVSGANKLLSHLGKLCVALLTISALSLKAWTTNIFTAAVREAQKSQLTARMKLISTAMNFEDMSRVTAQLGSGRHWRGPGGERSDVYIL